MPTPDDRFCGDCKHLLCCQVWNDIAWKCTRSQNRRELELEGINALRRQRCIRESWYEPRAVGTA